MRKFTNVASIGALALLTSQASAQLGFDDFNSPPDPRSLGNLAGLLDGNGGLGSSNTVGLLGSAEGGSGLASGDCLGNHHDRIQTGCNTGCMANEWGCDGALMSSGHVPVARSVLGSANELQAFIIPAQVMLQNTTTDVNSTFNSHSNGTRTKTQTDQYTVRGKFCKNKYECENNFERDDNCFYQNGCNVNDWGEFEGMHALDCDCNGLSSVDLNDFGPDGCDCGDENIKGELFDDPVVDITKRINKEIYKTIGDVLSQILSTAISESMTHAVTVD